MGKLVVTYDAKLLGKVADLAISPEGKVGLSVESETGEKSVISFDEVAAVGDVILLKAPAEAAPPKVKAAPKVKRAPRGPVCPSCGKVNKPGAKFCAKCGARLS